ncbi:MAG TPA: DNA polymerase III subunit gamma/tau [Patescibacteria group bacterium]|nr:DNA polymerase III subunit gamma/tau [Patescibacteria group bacterium]
MGKALYRKYRPKKLSEVVGQEHITDTLGRAIQQNAISHAYLFTGPRGVGKTSIARILAHEVNNLPYDEEATQLDIIEIDAASNRRIDEIRDLKERVNIAPTSAKYKVYIIDEVHMLTKEAFNALLKTLEEPPAHAIFILATTESHKVPETIVSRTQRFTFKPVARDKVVTHLKQIAKDEKVKIDDAALELIAAHGEGSFRDSISLLDQVRHSSDHITLETVQKAIGKAPQDMLEGALAQMQQHNITALAQTMTELRHQGAQAPQVAKQLAEILREGLINQQARFAPATALQLVQELLMVPSSYDPQLALELALFGVTLEGAPIKETQAVVEVASAEVAVSASPKQASNPIPEPSTTIVKSVAPAKTVNRSGVQTLNAETWQDVLQAVKGRHNTLYGIARMAIPSFSPGKLTLTFAFPFHQKRLSDGKNQQLLLDIVAETTGETVSLECLVDKDARLEPVIPSPATKVENPLNLQTISNIFGGAEIVE